MYRWSRLVEGLKPASSWAQARFSEVLKLHDEEGAWLHTDDLLLFHPTLEAHLDCLERILKRACEVGLVFSMSKCNFLMAQVEWLGRIIARGVVHPPVDYLQKLLERPRPSTVGQVRSWTASVGWVIDHLPSSQVLMAAINDLIRADTLKKNGVKIVGGKVPKAAPVQWTPEATAAFDKVRELCLHPATLQIPDMGKSFAVQCDGSGVGWGAVLLQRSNAEEWQHMQEEDRPWRPVAFSGGRWRSRRQQQAPARSLELGAMRAALVHWAHLLKNGRDIQVFTDHHSLSQSITPLPHDPDWVRRLISDIVGFPLQITHIPGATMGVPDLVSRL
jgi:hypothetical protein